MTFPAANLLDDPSANIDLRTRAVLSWLFDAPEAVVSPLLYNPLACPNCGVQVDSKRTPYCSEACQEESAFVRQLRSSLSNGTIADEERQASLGQKLWRVLGGGFPRREVLVPNRVLTKILERESGLCQKCGAPAVRIDHPGSG